MKWQATGTLENIINQEIFGEINKQINHLLNRKFYFDPDKFTLFIGDSYGSGFTPEKVVDSWEDYIINYLNLNENNYKKLNRGGAGFVGSTPSGTQGGSYLKLLQDNIEDITNKNEIRNIIVCGGYNDKSHLDDIPNAISNFISYCNSQFPNAQIFIGQIGWTILSSAGSIRNNLDQLTNIYNQNAHGKYTFLNNIDTVIKNRDFFSSDNVHPNEKRTRSTWKSYFTIFNYW